MITINRDGYICEMYIRGKEITVDVYERRWLFFRTFKFSSTFDWNEEIKLTDYAKRAIELVLFHYS